MSLRIESVIVRALAQIAPIVTLLKRRNRNLADQLDRASCSVLLNTSEGAYSQKGHQRARYFTALGSASETRSCLRLAVAQHRVVVDPSQHRVVVDPSQHRVVVDPSLDDDLDHVIAVLFKLTR